MFSSHAESFTDASTIEFALVSIALDTPVTSETFSGSLRYEASKKKWFIDRYVILL